MTGEEATAGHLTPGRPAPPRTPVPAGLCCVQFPRRQQEILALVAEGLCDKEIAARLGVSTRTVRTHLERIYQRYSIHSRSAAVALWLRNGGENYSPDLGSEFAG